MSDLACTPTPRAELPALDGAESIAYFNPARGDLVFNVESGDHTHGCARSIPLAAFAREAGIPASALRAAADEIELANDPNAPRLDPEHLAGARLEFENGKARAIGRAVVGTLAAFARGLHETT